jgi:uncharacterized membrane protein (UPF0127 family)
VRTALSRSRAVVATLLALALPLALTSGGCRGKGTPEVRDTDASRARTGRPTVVLLPTDGSVPRRVEVEVVRTASEWQRGLMFRQRLPDGTGMLFWGQESTHHSFWMKNTLIPLDIIFVTADLRVLGISENATPMTEDAREVPGDSLHVLVVPGGWSVRNHIGPGARLQLENVQ